MGWKEQRNIGTVGQRMRSTEETRKGGMERNRIERDGISGPHAGYCLRGKRVVKKGEREKQRWHE